MKVGLRAVSARHPAAPGGARAAVAGITLDIAAGEQVAIIGPSGAGKTSLLHVIACALRPSDGNVLLDGRDPWRISKAGLQSLRRELFLAPQVPPLPPRQRVVTAVLAGRLPRMGLWQSVRSLFYPVGIADADAALERFDLSHKLFARVDRLSGGERQRVSLARVLLSDARMILADEPLSALDTTRAQGALATLTQVARERGATFVATLHDVPMALANFPRVVALRDGQVVFDLPSDEVDQALLVDLYAQEAQSTELAPQPDAPVRPAVMHCR